jgi:hypothetical protein
MPGVVDTTHTFTTNEVITSTLMNNIIDQTLFTSDALSGGTLALVSGKMKVATSGITSNEIASNAVTTSAIASSSSASTGVTYAKMQYVDNMKALGNVSGSLGVVSEVSILDEDDMASDSATSLATQQSIKAYTDSKVVTRGTAVATTSGTSVDFTSIPSTVKRITVMLNGVSTNGTSSVIVQLGDSGGVETSGYSGYSFEIKATPAGIVASSGIILNSPVASSTCDGIVTLVNITGNTWVATFVGGDSIGLVCNVAGISKTLSATLDRIRITTAGGVNTFDAGQVNIMYE